MIIKNAFVLLVSFFIYGLLPAQDKKEPKKWDVNNPEGNYKEVNFTVNEGTWMNLDVSPDGSTIIFDLLGDIYTMPATGGMATLLRGGHAFEVQPRFSPDGKKILFTSDAGGGDNIWVMNRDGSKPTQVTKESFRLLNNGTWSPDGEYIVARKHFTSTRSIGAGEMWLYHISGGGGLQLLNGKTPMDCVVVVFLRYRTIKSFFSVAIGINLPYTNSTICRYLVDLFSYIDVKLY